MISNSDSPEISEYVSVPRMLDVNGVASYLGVSKSTVYEMIETLSLPSYPLGAGGRAIRVSVVDLQDYLRSIRRCRDKGTVPIKRLRPRAAKRLCRARKVAAG